MINFNIYNRFSGNIQFTAFIDCDENATESQKKRLAVLWAIENSADLRSANLRSATYGEGIPLTKPPVFLLGLIWDVMILDNHIKIGCQLHSTTEWENFSDEEINSMEDRALDFWKQWKDVILSMAKTHQQNIGK